VAIVFVSLVLQLLTLHPKYKAKHDNKQIIILLKIYYSYINYITLKERLAKMKTILIYLTLGFHGNVFCGVTDGVDGLGGVGGNSKFSW